MRPPTNSSAHVQVVDELERGQVLSGHGAPRVALLAVHRARLDLLARGGELAVEQAQLPQPHQHAGAVEAALRGRQQAPTQRELAQERQ